MVRQISETDNQAIILNATSMISSPTIFPGATMRDVQIVKAQIDNAITFPRLSTAQRAYLENIRSLLIERITVLDPNGAYTPSTSTPAEQGVFGLSGLKGYFGVM